MTRAPSRPMCRRWQTTDPPPEVLLQPSGGWDDARALGLPKEGFVVPEDVCLNISGLRHREAAVRVAPSGPVPSRAPSWCPTHMSLPGCREGAQGIGALPALHGSPPALEPEAGWRPSPHGEVGQGSGKGVTARHPRWGGVGGCERWRWAWRSRLPALTWRAVGQPPGVPGEPRHRGQWLGPRSSCMEAQLSSQDSVHVSQESQEPGSTVRPAKSSCETADGGLAGVLKP